MRIKRSFNRSIVSLFIMALVVANVPANNIQASFPGSIRLNANSYEPGETARVVIISSNKDLYGADVTVSSPVVLTSGAKPAGISDYDLSLSGGVYRSLPTVTDMDSYKAGGGELISFTFTVPSESTTLTIKIRVIASDYSTAFEGTVELTATVIAPPPTTAAPPPTTAAPITTTTTKPATTTTTTAAPTTPAPTTAPTTTAPASTLPEPTPVATSEPTTTPSETTSETTTTATTTQETTTEATTSEVIQIGLELKHIGGNGGTYIARDPDSSLLPAGFTTINRDILGSVMTTWFNDKTGQTLLYLEDPNLEDDFFLFDSVNNLLYPYHEDINFELDGERYLILPIDGDVGEISGFDVVEFSLDGQLTTALSNSENSNQVILQTLGVNGRRELYLYETAADGTVSIIAYTPELVNSEETSEETTSEATETSTETIESSSSSVPVTDNNDSGGGVMDIIMNLPLKGIAISFGAILLLLIVTLIVLSKMNRSKPATRTVTIQDPASRSRDQSSQPNDHPDNGGL